MRYSIIRLFVCSLLVVVSFPPTVLSYVEGRSPVSVTATADPTEPVLAHSSTACPTPTMSLSSSLSLLSKQKHRIGAFAVLTTTATISATLTATITPTISTTITATITPTISPTITSTMTPTSTPTLTATITPTITPTLTATIMPSATSFPTGLRLNEFLVDAGTDWNGDGTVSSTKDEYIEIKNIGSELLDLTGLKLNDETDTSPYELTGTLQSNEIAVYYGSQTGIVLNNSGDKVRLLAMDNSILDEHEYNNAQENQAWNRDKGGIWHDDWSPSPGEENEVPPTPTPTQSPTAIPSGLWLNEFMPRPAHDWNGDCESDSKDEYIELINRSDTMVDLNGLQLDDGEDGSSAYVLTGTLQVDEIALFFRSETGIALNDTGDEVRLLAPDGSLLDRHIYSSSSQDQVWSRDEQGTWHDDWSASPAQSNLAPAPTATPSATPSVTGVPTNSATPTATLTATSTATSTPSPSHTATSTPTLTSTPTVMSTSTSSATPTLANVTVTITTQVTETASTTATVTPTVKDAGTATATISRTPSTTSILTLTPTPTSSTTSTPTSTSTPASPTITSAPTVTPNQTPTSLPSGLQLNEFLPRPKSDWNGDGEINTNDEYIELMNRGDQAVDLTGLQLDDAEGGSSSYLLSGSLAVGEVKVYFRSETGIALNDTGGDEVRLLAADGTQIDVYAYASAANDQAMSRDERGEWHDESSPSPAQANPPPINITSTPAEATITSIADATLTPSQASATSTATSGSTSTSTSTATATATATTTSSISRSPTSVQLFISEVVYHGDVSGQGDEFVEIWNPTSDTIDVSGWGIGDEEVEGGNEGMYRLPANTQLPPNGTLVIARKADAFFERFQKWPDFAFRASSAESEGNTVPLLTRDKAWGSGNWALTDSGDEVILLDPSNRMVDRIAFRNGDFAALGLTGHDISAPAPKAIHHVDRLHSNNVNDWVAYNEPTPGEPYLIPDSSAIPPLGPNFEGLRVAWGSLHSHSTYSDGSGPPELAFAVARANGMNFMALTDHSNWYVPSEREHMLAVAKEANRPGEFLAMLAFEWTHRTDGHSNVFLTENDSSRERADGETLAAFYEWLQARPQALASFNHPFRKQFNDLKLDPTVQEQFFGLEVGNGSGGTFARYEEKYWEALQKGWRVGALGNLDTETADWGNDGPLRTGVLLTELTQDAFFEALRARRTFATEDKNLSLALKVDEVWMGGDVLAGSLVFSVLISDANNEAAQLELLRNEEVVASESVSILSTSNAPYVWQVPFDAQAGEIYAARLIQADGDHAWSSPIWVVDEFGPSGGSGDSTPIASLPDDASSGSSQDTESDEADAVSADEQQEEGRDRADAASADEQQEEEPEIGGTLAGDEAILAIAEVRTLAEDSRVTIEGVVIASPGTFDEQSMYVQDATGGIKIYRYAGLDRFALGDQIRMTGYTKLHFGEIELSIPESQEVNLLATGQPVQPKTVSPGTLGQYGGQLVQVTGKVERWSGDHWLLNDGQESIFVYHDADTGVKRPEFAKNETRTVIGIVGWSEQGPRLMPRSEADLLPVGTIGVVGTSEEQAPQRLPVTGEQETGQRCQKGWPKFMIQLMSLIKKGTC